MNTYFEDVVTLYQKSQIATISRHRVEHHALGVFSVNLDSLTAQLGDLVTDDFWRFFISPLKRLRFGLCAAPFVEEYRMQRISEIICELQPKAHQCKYVFPNFADQANAVMLSLGDLLQATNDPLLEKLIELTPVHQQVGWVIKESRLIPDVEELNRGLDLPLLKIIHPLQLRGVTCYDQLIYIVIFDWTNDRWRPSNVFAKPHKSTGPANRRLVTIREHETGNRWDNIDPENLLIIANRAASARAVVDRVEQDEYDSVEARCVFFEGDLVMFIDATVGTSTLIIDPDQDADDRITRIDVSNLEAGTFVLVRTTGGGDYIVSTADKIMGSQAMHARSLQSQWKGLLREYVRRQGLFETCIHLIDLGSNIANETNIRNWMSPRSIRTQSIQDFRAIMKLVGLGDKTEEYWKVMSQINKAHHRAGFVIRDSLLDQVRGLDVEDLHKRGKMDFRLAEDAENGLTAYRVQAHR